MYLNADLYKKYFIIFYLKINKLKPRFYIKKLLNFFFCNRCKNNIFSCLYNIFYMYIIKKKLFLQAVF